MIRSFFRRICCFLFIVTILFVNPGFSRAASGNTKRHTCGENLTWNLDAEGLLTVSGTGDMYSCTEKSSPWDSFSVKRIILEEGVASIGDWAFSGCHFLKSIEIPGSIVRIGDYAFSRCYDLKAVSLPDGIREVGANPFVSCTALREIGLSPDHPNLAFENGMLLSRSDDRLILRLSAEPSTDCFIPEGTRIIGDYAFSGCENLHRVVIPDGVGSVGSFAFSGCSVLGSPAFPAGLVSVGDFAFSGCHNLYHVRFEEGLTSIGKGAFRGCWLLKEIDLPDTLTGLGSNPFEDCRELSEIHLSEDHLLLGLKDGILYSKPDMKMIFYAAGNESETFSVPDGIAAIGEGAFSNASALRKILLPGSVRQIEKEGFWSCQNTEEIVFSEGLKTIDERAFAEMTSLKEANLPEGLESIGDLAFLDCPNLEKAVIPESVTQIGKDIFAGADTLNLAVYVAPDSVAEEYCRQNNLKAVNPGQPIPEPEVPMPPEFTAQYPGYTGRGKVDVWARAETEDAYLAEAPDGSLVLLCGTEHEGTGWTIVKSTPLPENTRLVLHRDLQLIDLGFARCAVRRYFDDVWGIDYTGSERLFIGPNWIGQTMPPSLYFGKHPWGDLTKIDWKTLTEDPAEARRVLDVSACAFANRNDPDGRIPIFSQPDPDSEKIAGLIGGVPLPVTERNGEWTKVSLGREDGNSWKMEGWVRSEDLEFRQKAHKDDCFEMNPDVYSRLDEPVTLVTPKGSHEIVNVNKEEYTWLVIGDTIINNREYWLLYQYYTEEIGFVLKDELYEPNG